MTHTVHFASWFCSNISIFGSIMQTTFLGISPSDVGNRCSVPRFPAVDSVNDLSLACCWVVAGVLILSAGAAGEEDSEAGGGGEADGHAAPAVRGAAAGHCGGIRPRVTRPRPQRQQIGSPRLIIALTACSRATQIQTVLLFFLLPVVCLCWQCLVPYCTGGRHVESCCQVLQNRELSPRSQILMV